MASTRSGTSPASDAATAEESFRVALLSTLARLGLAISPVAAVQEVSGWTGVLLPWALGATIAIMGDACRGWTVTARTAPVAVACLCVSAAVHPDVPAAVAVVIAAVAYHAYLAHYGYHIGSVAVPFVTVITLAAPPDVVTAAVPPSVDAAHLIAYAITVSCGAAWTAAVWHWSALRPPGRPPDLVTGPTRLAWAYLAVMAPLVGLQAWAVLTWLQGYRGTWMLVATVMLTAPNSYDVVRGKAVGRTTGAILGALVVLLVIAAWPPLGVLYGLVFLAFGLAFTLLRLRKPYWTFATAMTVAVIMIGSIGIDQSDAAVWVDAQRPLFTLIGAACAMAATLTINALAGPQRPDAHGGPGDRPAG